MPFERNETDPPSEDAATVAFSADKMGDLLADLDMSEDAATVLYSRAAMDDMLAESGVLLDDMTTDEDIEDYDSLATGSESRLGTRPTQSAAPPPAPASAAPDDDGYQRVFDRFPRPGARPEAEPESRMPAWAPWAIGAAVLAAIGAGVFFTLG